MRTALAKGADRAIHVEVDDKIAEKIEPLNVAKVSYKKIFFEIFQNYSQYLKLFFILFLLFKNYFHYR